MARFTETLEAPMSIAPSREPALYAVERSSSLLERAKRCDGTRASLDAVAREASFLRSIEIPRGDRARLAFWLNVYNALTRHAVYAYEARGSLLSHRAIFERAAYTVAGHRCSLDDIEHGILRKNARKPLAIARPFSSDDPRIAWGPSSLDPKVHFALNCGAKSCPLVRAYREETVERELRLASKDYFASECVVDRRKLRVELPFLMLLYWGDFGGRDGRLPHALAHLERTDALWLTEHAARVKFRYRGYDWTIVR